MRSVCVPLPTPGAPTRMMRAALRSNISEAKEYLGTAITSSSTRKYVQKRQMSKAQYSEPDSPKLRETIRLDSTEE